MLPFTFEAQCVVVEHPGGECHLVGFADQKYDTKLYLMFQRSFDDDEQDVRLGMNTYHVEWCGQENSGYGGISQFTLRRAIAEIAFEATMAEVLGGINQIAISFRLPDSEFLSLKAALSNIFAGSNCFAAVDT